MLEHRGEGIGAPHPVENKNCFKSQVAAKCNCLHHQSYFIVINTILPMIQFKLCGRLYCYMQFSAGNRHSEMWVINKN